MAEEKRQRGIYRLRDPLTNDVRYARETGNEALEAKCRRALAVSGG